MGPAHRAAVLPAGRRDGPLLHRLAAAIGRRDPRAGAGPPGGARGRGAADLRRRRPGPVRPALHADGDDDGDHLGGAGARRPTLGHALPPPEPAGRRRVGEGRARALRHAASLATRRVRRADAQRARRRGELYPLRPEDPVRAAPDLPWPPRRRDPPARAPRAEAQGPSGPASGAACYGAPSCGRRTPLASPANPTPGWRPACARPTRPARIGCGPTTGGATATLPGTRNSEVRTYFAPSAGAAGTAGSSLRRLGSSFLASSFLPLPKSLPCFSAIFRT